MVEILERADVSHALSRRLRLRILCPDGAGAGAEVTALIHQQVYSRQWRRWLNHPRYDIVFAFIYLTYQDYRDVNPYIRVRWVKPGFDAPDGWGSGETIGNVTIIHNDQYEALRDLRLR